MDSICENIYDYSPIIKLEHLINQDDIILYVFIGKNQKLKDLLEDITFDAEDPFNTEISSINKKDLKKMVGDNFLSRLFNLNKKYKSVHFVDRHIHLDDTIINIKKKISHTLKIPISKLNIWCNSEKKFSNIGRENLFNILTDNIAEGVSAQLIKDFITSVNYISTNDIDLGIKDSDITYTEWMKSDKMFQYIDNLQVPIDRRINYFTKEKKNLNYEINPYKLTRNVGETGEELASLLWCDKQGNKKRSIINIDNLLILESFSKITDNTLYVVDFDSFKKHVDSSKDIPSKFHQYGIYYRFFPLLKDTNDTYQLDKEENNRLYENEKRDRLIQKYFELSKLEADCKITELHLINNNLKNSNINLRRLFDNIPLSFDIPFSRIYDDDIKMHHYKIFKPSIVNELVDKKLLDCWINGRDNCFYKRNSNNTFKLKGLQWRIKVLDNNYLALNLTKEGECKVKIAFPEGNIVDTDYLQNYLRKTNEIIHIINQYFDVPFKINLLETNIWLSSFTTHIDNVKFQLNVRSNNNNTEDFKQLLKKFNNFLVLDIEVNKKSFYRFRKINNYNSSSMVENQIAKYLHDGFSMDSILEELTEKYGYPKNEASDLISNYVEKEIIQQVNKSRFRDPGVVISFLYSNNSFICGIEGCKSIFLVSRIYQLLKSLINIFNTADMDKDDYNTLELLSSDIEKTEKLFKEIEVQYSVDDAKDMDDASISDSDLDESDEDDDDSDEDDDDSDDSEDGLIVAYKTNEEEKENKTSKASIKDTISIDEHTDLKTLKLNTYYLDRIKSLDRNITGDNYASRCQTSNQSQPIIISDKKKEGIDTIDKKKNTTSYDKSSAVRFGNNDRQYWYICPIAWCVKCEMSLSMETLEKENNRCPFCKGKVNENKNDNPETHPVIIRNKHIEDGDIELFPGFLNTGKNKDCKPCCYKKNSLGDTKVEDKSANKTDKLLECYEKWKDSEYKPTMIGDKTLDEYMSSFLNNEKKKTSSFETNKKYIKLVPFDSICDYSRFCELPEILYQFFNYDLHSKLDKSPGYDTRPSMIRKDEPCLLKEGVNEVDNSFFNVFYAMIPYINNSKDNEIQGSIEFQSEDSNVSDFRNKISEKLKPEQFFQLMDGNLVTIFKDQESIFDIIDSDFNKWLETENILFTIFDKHEDSNKQLLYNIYSGYRNYKRYIAESKYIDYNYLVELFVSKNTWPFISGLNIIMFELSENKSKEIDLNILCPPDGRLKSFIGKPDSDDYVILLKINDNNGLTFFEPVINVLATKSEEKGIKDIIKKTYELNRSEHIQDFQYDFKQLLSDACKLSKKEEDLFSNNSVLINILKKYSLDNITQLISSDTKIEGLLINYNEISNNYDYYIPVINQGINLNYKTITDNLDINWLEYQDTIKSLNKLFNITNEEINIKVNKKIVSNDNTIIVGLLTQYQEMIPIKHMANTDEITLDMKTGNKSDSLQLVTNDLILMRKINDERLSFSKKYDYENRLYHQIRYEVSKLLQISNDELNNILKDKVLLDSGINIKNEIKHYISNDILTYSMKKEFLTPVIDTLISIIISNDDVVETEFKKCKSLGKMNICNKSIFCAWSKEKCNVKVSVLQNSEIDETELITYFRDKLVDELIRKPESSKEILSGNVNIINVFVGEQEIVLSEDDINYLENWEKIVNTKYHRDISVYDIIASSFTKQDKIKKSEVHTSKVEIKPVSYKQNVVKNEQKSNKSHKKPKNKKTDKDIDEHIFKIYSKRNKDLKEGKNVCLARVYGDDVGYPCQTSVLEKNKHLCSKHEKGIPHGLMADDRPDINIETGKKFKWGDVSIFKEVEVYDEDYGKKMVYPVDDEGKPMLDLDKLKSNLSDENISLLKKKIGKKKKLKTNDSIKSDDKDIKDTITQKEKDDYHNIKKLLTERYENRNKQSNPCQARTWYRKQEYFSGAYGFPCKQHGMYTLEDGTHLCGTHYDNDNNSIKDNVKKHGLMKDSLQNIKGEAQKLKPLIDKEIEIEGKLIPVDKNGNPIIEI